MMYNIQNSLLSLTVAELGAEMKSLISKADGREWLWDADPDFWPRTAPVLFPIVGKLADNQYIYQSRFYPMSQHGFARDRVFECIEKDADRLVFFLKSDYDSHKFYPFDFELFIRYQLVDNRLEISYEVRNSGIESLWFSIGGHPGFALPSWPEKSYELHFEQAENLHPYSLKSGLLGRKISEPMATELHTLPISLELFENDALVFDDLKSEWIAIRPTGEPDELRVHFKNFPWIGLWAKTGAPFICIEPWYGHADPVGESGDLTEKPGILMLPESETFRCSYEIEIRPTV